MERLRNEAAIQAQLRREAEEKPEVPPPIFNLFSIGRKGKLSMPALKGVNAGVNTEEVTEPVEEEKIECVTLHRMVGVAPVALVDG